GQGGAPEYAMFPGTVTANGIGGFGNWAPILQLDTPYKGYSSIYYGHAGPPVAPVNTHLSAGQQIAVEYPGIAGISTGPHLEIGFGPYGGSPNASAYAMQALLLSLLGTGGAPQTGGVGGAGSAAVSITIPTLKPPPISGSGTMASIDRGFAAMLTKAANAYLQKRASSSLAGSGPYNPTSLESLWNQAHGAGSMAHLMSAIALAESSGNPAARGPTDAQGNVPEGLWQIKMPLNAASVPGGNAFNPLANAEGAVNILASQGLGAWATYGSGAYRAFMASGGLLPLMFAKGGLAKAWH